MGPDVKVLMVQILKDLWAKALAPGLMGLCPCVQERKRWPISILTFGPRITLTFGPIRSLTFGPISILILWAIPDISAP